MFKKTVETKNQQRLSGADKKKLRRNLLDKFPRASASDLDVLLPPKTEVTVAKLQNRVHVYSVEGGFPMFFDVDGRGSEIYPTVYALWKAPDILPAFYLKGGEVSRFLIGGADLMFPGIIVPPEGLATFRAGEPWAVKVPYNPAPIAVGATTMSSAEAVKAGLRGKALRISHHYGDLLWLSAEGRYVPNAGFFEDVVFEDPAFTSSSQDPESCEDISMISSNQQNDAENKTADYTDTNTGNNILVTDKDGNKDCDQQLATDISHLEVTDAGFADGSSVKESISAKDVDALLDKCLLQALHTTIKDKDLPMPGSTLWSNHVLPCRPSGVTLDIKKSSYKKLSKWLQAKSTSGLIAVKEDKYKKEIVLLSISRGSAEYTSFKPERQPAVKADQPSDHAAGENKTLEVIEVFKPSSHVRASLLPSEQPNTRKRLL